MKRFGFVPAVLITLVGLFFFSFNKTKPRISSGRIFFECHALDTSMKGLVVPSIMEMSFGNDFTNCHYEAGMGFAKFQMIADPVKKEFHNLIWFFEKKQSLLDSLAVDSINHYFPAYDVKYGTAKKKIAGYDCQDAEIVFRNGDPSFTVWFTYDIDIENPNWANPYYKINGVLLDYQANLYGLKLHNVAARVSDETIDPKEFEVPGDYEMTPNAELVKMMEGFY